MNNIFNLKNIEVKLIIPLMVIGGLFPSACILLGLITGLILLFNIFMFLRNETIVKIMNVAIFISLLSIGHYEIIIPIYNILMLLIAAKFQNSNFIKYYIMATLVFCLIMLLAPIDLKIKTFNLLCMIIYLFINRKLFQKWNIKNLDINNFYYKIMTYFSLLCLFGMNLFYILRKDHHNEIIDNRLEYFLPLIICQILYIVIYPFIRKNVYVEREKKI